MSKGKNRIPATATLLVAESKLLNYLLNDAHHEGKSKSKYFKACGFTRENWLELRAALVAHGKQRPIVSTEVSDYGTKHAVECELQSPDGKSRCIRTIWVVESGSDYRLVTAYPLA